MPPPSVPAVLPLMTLRWTISGARLPTLIPPPSAVAAFPVIAQSLTVNDPALPVPPPA